MTRYLATIHVVFDTEKPPTVFLMERLRNAEVLGWAYMCSGATRRIIPFLPVEVADTDPIHNLATRFGVLSTWRPIR